MIADNTKTTTPEQEAQDFVNLPVAGTPERYLAKFLPCPEKVGFDYLIADFISGRMPPEKAERHMRLFAPEVLPKLRGQGTPVTVGGAVSQIPAK